MKCFTVADSAERHLIAAMMFGMKTVETRNRCTLSALIGSEPVGLVENVNGKKVLRCMVLIGQPVRYSNAIEFARDYDRHRITIGSPWFKSRGVGYTFSVTEIVEPVEITNDMIKCRHGYSWFEI